LINYLQCQTQSAPFATKPLILLNQSLLWKNLTTKLASNVLFANHS